MKLGLAPPTGGLKPTIGDVTGLVKLYCRLVESSMYLLRYRNSAFLVATLHAEGESRPG